jgi:enoyl-CoA hydratase
VNAAEALAWGLANRVVPHGQARAAAETLAAEIAAFPQVCMRGDRRSALEGLELDDQAAMARELELGMAGLQSESLAGAALFSSGKGRHGKFD